MKSLSLHLTLLKINRFEFSFKPGFSHKWIPTKDLLFLRALAICFKTNSDKPQPYKSKWCKLGLYFIKLQMLSITSISYGSFVFFNSSKYSKFSYSFVKFISVIVLVVDIDLSLVIFCYLITFSCISFSYKILIGSNWFHEILTDVSFRFDFKSLKNTFQCVGANKFQLRSISLRCLL